MYAANLFSVQCKRGTKCIFCSNVYNACMRRLRPCGTLGRRKGRRKSDSGKAPSLNHSFMAPRLASRSGFQAAARLQEVDMRCVSHAVLLDELNYRRFLLTAEFCALPGPHKVPQRGVSMRKPRVVGAMVYTSLLLAPRQS